MAKADIVIEIVKKNAIPTTLEEITTVARTHTTAKENLCLHSFGTLEIIKRKEKLARNFSTSAPPKNEPQNSLRPIFVITCKFLHSKII